MARTVACPATTGDERESLSARQFQLPDLLQIVTDALQQSGLAAIDDFGTGYSSLAF